MDFFGWENFGKYFFWGGRGVFKTNVSCNAFWKFFWFRNSSWDFGGLNF